jgi:preprotein translocase subunit SecB
MNHSPLQLEHHFFTKVELIANQKDVDPQAINNIEAKVDAGCSSPPSDPEAAKRYLPQYRVSLTVRLSRFDQRTPAYTGEFVACGYFRVHPGYPSQKCANLVAVNGASLLYGAVREMVANLTARGPYPKVTLVSLNFNDLLISQADSPPGTEPPSTESLATETRHPPLRTHLRGSKRAAKETTSKAKKVKD